MDTQTLTIKLAAEVAEFISKIKGVESLVSGVAQRMRDSFSGLWATLGATVSVAGLGAFVKASINAMDQLDELSQRYGVSVKELSGLQLAFKQSGIEQDAMASSMGKLQRAMADGNRGLAAIGVGTRNADGSLRGTSAVLLDVADKFAGLQDGAGKTALAVEIFGKSGADMVPLLNSGSDGIKDMISTAERLGLVLEDEVAAKAGNFNDTLELVGMGAQGVGRGIAARLLPTLQSLAENFLTSMTNGDRLAKTAEFLASILKGLYIGALAVVEVFSTLGKTFGAVIGAFFAAAQGNFKEAWAILKEGGADVSKGWQETAAQISAAWSGAGGDTVAALAAAGGAAKKHAPDLKAIEENAKAAAKALEEQRKEQEAQAKLVAELSGVQADYELSLQRIQAQRDAGNLSEERYIELVTALIAKQPMAKKLMDEHGKATADLAAQQNQAFDDYFERSERERMAVEARIKVGRTTLEQLQFENSLLGLNTTEREVAIAMRELERQGVVKGTEAWDRYAAAIKAAVVDRESQREAIGFWDSIQSTAKNVFTDVANNGVSAFERIGKTIKAAVLDLLWQVTGQRWLISLGTSMGVPGAANAASSSGGSSLSDAMGFAGTAGAFGTGMGAAFTSIVQAGVGGWATAAGSLIGTGTMSGVAAGLGMIAGPLMAVVAVASLLSSLDDSGTSHTGGYGSYSAAGGATRGAVLRDGPDSPFGLSDDAITTAGNNAAVAVAQTVVGMLDSTAATFGSDGGFSASTALADDSSKDVAWGSLLIKDGAGNVRVNWADTQTSRWAPKEFADGETGAKQYALAVAKDVRDVLIDETPAWADTMLNALGDAPTLEQLAGTVAQIHAAAAAFDTMGRASEQFAALSESALDALVTAMGGAEAAVAGLGNYYSSFYTDAERADVTRSQLQDKFTGLGLGELPQTRDQFRSIVESLDLTTVSGRAMYAELIKLSPAFASITEATQDAGAAMAAAAEQAARAAEQAFEKAKSTAYSQLEASAERERALWEQQASAAASLRDEVRGVFDTLATNIRELRGEALGPELTAAQGQAFINGALASVNAGTGLPDGEGLTNAIAAVRGGLSSPGMYANSMERDFAALRLAGELSVLQEAAGEQLTTAELQLQAAENQIDQLDETLAYWRKLIDGTEDGIDATKSVADAVKALTLLMFPEDTAAGGAAGAGAGAGGGQFVIGGSGPGTPARPAPPASTLSRLGNTYYGSLGTIITDAPSIGRFDSINTAINTFDWSEANKPASVAAITTAAVENGATTRDIAIATGLPLDSVNALFPNIPRYLLGTNYVPETGLALLHKGEAVVPQAYNPMAGAPYQPTGMGDNTQVVALLQQIAARVAALEGHAATSADANAQSADVLTRVAQGNSLTTSAAPAIA
ncbi:MAG: hypothetical protein WBK26_05310 [Burkholderiaceae bacterium]